MDAGPDRTLRPVTPRRRVRRHRPQGKIYAASSIKWRSSITLEQTGNAPNVAGGVWSLATCKHHMRSVGTFTGWFSADDDGVYRPEKPVFIYTVAGESVRDLDRHR